MTTQLDRIETMLIRLDLYCRTGKVIPLELASKKVPFEEALRQLTLTRARGLDNEDGEET
jgi:hypothetical protein